MISHRDIDKAIESLKTKPRVPKKGRGIIIPAGGPRLSINAWVCIRMLRALGCTLPIQVWYLGQDELNPAWESLVRQYNVECVNAHDYLDIMPHRMLHGWELKPYALANTKYEEVLLLDADNVPVVDPTYLFNDSEFLNRGTVFWPDFGRLSASRDAWKTFGNIPYRDEPEVESGQILIDTARCYRELDLCNWYMQNSRNYFFRHVHGDKEVFHLSWRKLGSEYAMPDYGIHALDGVMCQHDFLGNRVFQHRNLRKWDFYYNPTTPGFAYEDTCLAFIRDLQAIWSPAASTLPTGQDIVSMRDIDGKLFQYIRVGYDKRPMRFSRLGTIIEGGAACEFYWTIRNNILYIAEESGDCIMTLAKDSSGGWKGHWLKYEKMPIHLVPH